MGKLKDIMRHSWVTLSKLLYTDFGLVQFSDSSEVPTVSPALCWTLSTVPPALCWTLSTVPGTLLDTVGDLKGARGGALSNLPEELSILVETEMKSMKWFLRTVSCVNDSSVSCQAHLKPDSVIICIIPGCVTLAFDRHTLSVFKSLLKTLARQGQGGRQEGASWRFPYHSSHRPFVCSWTLPAF